MGHDFPLKSFPAWVSARYSMSTQGKDIYSNHAECPHLDHLGAAITGRVQFLPHRLWLEGHVQFLCRHVRDATQSALEAVKGLIMLI